MAEQAAHDDVVIGEDGLGRCRWGVSTPDYVHYHDTEWGVPTSDERTLFEKMCLEGFQSGLSWLTILRKRQNFRAAFANFDSATVAEFGDDDIARLLDDAGIIRHRGKIEATINNAQVLEGLHAEGTTLASLIWAHEPAERQVLSFADVPAKNDSSIALSKQLRKLGFKFVGPTTAYAAMQAMGVVNDHVEGCHAQPTIAALRSAFERP